MKTATRYQIEGLSELKAAIKALPKNLQSIAVRDAHKEILKKVAVKTRKLAPVKNLRKAGYWKTTADKSKYLKNPTAAIMAPTIEAYKLRWIERGTAQRVITRGVKKGDRYKKGALKGARRGMVVARPFIENAYVQQARAIIEQAGDAYYGVMLKVLNRHGVRYKKKLAKQKAA